MWSSKPPTEEGFYWINHSGDLLIASVRINHFIPGEPLMATVFWDGIADCNCWRLDEIDAWGEKIIPPSY